MKCPGCEHDNRAGRRFCAACGAALASDCPACGFANDAAEKFCGGCGMRLFAVPPLVDSRFTSPQAYTPEYLAEKILTSRSALEGERKQVTVLFADLKGSMELLGDRDPEEARQLLDPVLERMMEAVHHCEGTVNQVMGDGIMALFGAPVAHEDHAVRACYAALRMQNSIRGFAEQAERNAGVAIQIRVGLNSGDVVVRSVGSDLHMDYTAVGQTTHLAARIEQATPPGAILMSAHTLALVEGYVQVRSLKPRLLKGLAQPIDLFEVVGTTTVRSRFDAATARGLTRFVGRDRELGELHCALERAAAGQGQVVAVSGEAGMGKSRLFWELMHAGWTDGWLIVQCGAVSYGEAPAYRHLIELLKSYFQLDAHDDASMIRDKVTGKLLLLDAQHLAPLAAPFLWLLDAATTNAEWEQLDPATRRQRALDGLRQLLLRHSQAQPLLLVFENLHWVDAEAQALLDSLIDDLAGARILLLVNYRPEYKHGWSDKPCYRALPIDALAPESADAMLDPLLGGDASVQPLKRMLFERTEGNPLFLEECVRALVDTHVLVGEAGRYRAAEAAQTIRLPATVRAILAARIDRLVPEHKRLLEAASVIGRDVPLEVLRAIAEESDAALTRGLRQLQVTQFLYETSTFPKAAFTFKHALTHDVVYENLLRERRRRLHVQTMKAIEQLDAERLAEQADRLAYHAVRGELWDKAAQYLLQAGQKSIRLSAYREALAHLSEGLDALARQPTTPERLSLELDYRVSIGSTQLATLGWAAPQVQQTYARARELCDAVGYTPRLFPVLWGIATFYLIRSQIELAVDAAQRFLALARRSEDDAPALVGEFLMGNTLHWTGELARTRTHLEASLARYDPGRHACLADTYGQDIRVSALTYMGWTLWYQGYPDQALRCHDDAVRLATQTNHAHSIAYADGVRLFALQLRGATQELLDRGATAIAFADARGVGFFAAFDRFLRAWALARLEGAPDAIEQMRRALVDYRATGAELPGVAFRSMLADALLHAGRPQEALDEVVLAQLSARQLHDRIWEPEVLRLKGLCMLALPDPAQDQAHECFGQAIALARSRGAKGWELRASISLARCLCQRGQPGAGQDLLAPVFESFSEGFETADLRDARALLLESV